MTKIAIKNITLAFLFIQFSYAIDRPIISNLINELGIVRDSTGYYLPIRIIIMNSWLTFQCGSLDLENENRYLNPAEVTLDTTSIGNYHINFFFDYKRQLKKAADGKRYIMSKDQGDYCFIDDSVKPTNHSTPIVLEKLYNYSEYFLEVSKKNRLVNIKVFDKSTHNMMDSLYENKDTLKQKIEFLNSFGEEGSKVAILKFYDTEWILREGDVFKHHLGIYHKVILINDHKLQTMDLANTKVNTFYKNNKQ